MRRNGDVHEAMPFPIAFIQVDGGSEFMADFERRREALRIPLEVLPPRRPQWNGCGLLTNRFLRERVPVTGAFQERRVGQRVQKGQQLRPFLRRHVEPLYELALVEVVAAVATLMPLHLKVCTTYSRPAGCGPPHRTWPPGRRLDAQFRTGAGRGRVPGNAR